MTATERLVVIGAGGMGRCALDVIDEMNRAGARFEVVGVLDDGHPDEILLKARDVEYLGPVAAIHDLPPDVGYVIGIGSTRAKRAIDAALMSTGRPSPILVHPNVHAGFDVEFSPGAIICSHVSIENHIRLGRHAHVNQNSTVGHDTVIGDYCTVSPLVAVSGNVTMSEAVFVGTGAAIRQGTNLHRCSTVGMSACVLGDVEADATVVGVPAAPLRRSS